MRFRSTRHPGLGSLQVLHSEGIVSWGRPLQFRHPAIHDLPDQSTRLLGGGQLKTLQHAVVRQVRLAYLAQLIAPSPLTVTRKAQTPRERHCSSWLGGGYDNLPPSFESLPLSPRIGHPDPALKAPFPRILQLAVASAASLRSSRG